jgi:hypothetical protein
MKVNLKQLKSDQSKQAAYRTVNEILRQARLDILESLPVPQRKLFHAQIHKERRRLLSENGVVIPETLDMRDRDQRREFMKTLSPAIKIKVYKGVSKFTSELAKEFGLPEIAELEQIRHYQLQGVQLNRNEEDASAITQVTHDVAANVVSKFKQKRANDSGLSIRAAVSDSGTSKPVEPTKH